MNKPTLLRLYRQITQLVPVYLATPGFRGLFSQEILKELKQSDMSPNEISSFKESLESDSSILYNYAMDYIRETFRRPNSNEEEGIRRYHQGVEEIKAIRTLLIEQGRLISFQPDESSETSNTQ